MREVKESSRLKTVLSAILQLGNILNQGTSRGAAAGFKLESLRQLANTKVTGKRHMNCGWLLLSDICDSDCFLILRMLFPLEHLLT